jgi:hypothetical protein
MKKLILLSSIILFFAFSTKAQSLRFDGINDAVGTSASNDATTYANWTYECWVQSPQAPNSAIGMDGPMYGENMGILWNHGSGFLGSAFVRASSGAYYAASFGPLNANTWYHLAATYDGTNLRAYRNGELMSLTVTTGGVFASTNFLALGVHPTGNAFFEGLIDDVRVWNVVRTCAEINNTMNSELNGNENGLMAYYKFNEGTPGANNTSFSFLLNSQNNTSDGTVVGFSMTGTASNFSTTAPFNNSTQPCSNGTGPGASLRFNGVYDHINLGNDNYYQLNQGTLEAWIRTSDAGSGYRGIVVKEFAYGLFLKNNILTAFHWATGTENSAGVAINDNQWHHVAYVFRTGINASQLYIDGIAVGAPFTHAIANQSADLLIGNNASQIHYFTGYIDEVRVWGRALCDNEIQTNKNCEIGTVGSTAALLGNFHFNQGVNEANNTLVDMLINSGSGADGYLNNFSLTGINSNWTDQAAVTSGNTCSNSPYTVTVSGNTLTSDAPGATAYQWYNCATNTPILNATSQSYIATASGDYSVQVTIGTCVIGSDCGNVTVTGINENTTNTINIYPNPTSSILNIEVNEQTQITIVNVLGEVVKTQTIKGLSTIDVTELNTGVYFIQSNTGMKAKFIKQ